MEFELFPVPAIPKHWTQPRTFPGATSESTKTLQRLLLENHEKWHIMFDDRGFHNHISHHLIVLWALGAAPNVIQRAYDAEVASQRPIDHGVTEDVVPITEANFCDHLGEQRYYQNYLKFFKDRVASQGAVEVIAKFIFSSLYATTGQMLNRYHAGLLHPFIHVGYGLEFQLPGMVSEGLAMAAVTRANRDENLMSSFTENSSSSGISSLPTRLLSSLSLGGGAGKQSTTPVKTPHALTFLTRIDADPDMDVSRTSERASPDIYAKYAKKLQEYVKEWIGDAAQRSGPTALLALMERKVEEVVWMNVVIYAAAGSNSDETLDFKCDFYTMHLVNSSIFLPSHLANLQYMFQTSLAALKAYFTSSLVWYIARRDGKSINLTNFYRNTNYYLLHKDHSGSKDLANAWTSVIESSIMKQDEHYPKLQRALMHHSVLYGTKTFDDVFGDSASDKDGASEQFEKLDGTLFWRAAAVTQETAGGAEKGATGVGGGSMIWSGISPSQ